MPIQITPAIQQQFPLLSSLAGLLPRFQEIQGTQGGGNLMPAFLDSVIRDTVIPVVNPHDILEEFDRQAITALPKIFIAKDQKLLINIGEFFMLQNFLFQIRNQLLVQHDQPVPVPVLTTPQARVISPGKEAYELMGNNLLNIRESLNGYGLIFE